MPNAEADLIIVRPYAATVMARQRLPYFVGISRDADEQDSVVAYDPADAR